MKKFLFLFTLTFSTVLISACSSSATPDASIIQEGKIDKTIEKLGDHHEGETNVAPHDDNPSPAEAHDDADTAPHGHDPVGAHDDSNEPPHRH